MGYVVPYYTITWINAAHPLFFGSCIHYLLLYSLFNNSITLEVYFCYIQIFNYSLQYLNNFNKS